MAPIAPVAWVTGASGFIGGHVARRFRDQGWTVVAIDRVMPSDPHVMPVAAEITPTALLKAQVLGGIPQAVFHGAGNGSVGRSLEDPAMCRRDTLESTVILLAHLRAHAPQCRLVFPSSAAVYGAAGDEPLAEDHPPNPVSPYGHHKLAAEQACIAAAADGLPVAILRMFSVYGPGLRKQLPWDLGSRLLDSLGGTVTLFGTGAETRDFFCVTDAARLIVDLAINPHRSPLIVNGGTGVATTVATFTHGLATALDVSASIVFNGLTRPGDPQHYRADRRKLAGLGFKPAVDLMHGLRNYAAWLREARGG